jgi:phospho-N-acetylmuramoyl-pentapeptide-transferase
MVYNFLLEFVDIFSFLNVFKYITFRTGLAVFTSLILVLIVGGPFIRMVSKKKLLTQLEKTVPQTTS